MTSNQTTAVAEPSALDIADLTKHYGDTRAVDGLSLTAARGEVLALLGPNGAGKTTTIEICEGFIQPTSGKVRVLGLDPSKNPDGVRRRIGIMLQGGGAYPGIRVGEMLQLVAGYSANPLDTEWLLEQVGLQRHRRTTYRRLSGGQQQRLSLALALVGRPELIFLDEPTAGLDAQSRLAVWDLIGALRRDGATVVLTTHFMDEAEALADKVVIIDSGRKVAEGTPSELITGTASGNGIRLDTAGALNEQALAADVHHLSGESPTVVALRPMSYRVSGTPTPRLIAAVTQAVANQNVLIRSLSSDNASLEDVFLDITGRDMRG